MKKPIFFFVLTCLFSFYGYAQDTSDTLATTSKPLKPFRVGVRVGVPNLATINAEYLTPLAGNRISLTADYFGLSQTFDDVDVSYANFEIGSNIYFNSTGKGFYGGVSYFSFTSEATYTEVDFGGLTTEGQADFDFNTINLKLGVKVGRGFYFRTEVGYGFGDIPQQITATSSSSLTTTVERPDIPGLSDNGIIVFNLGFGVGF